MSLAKKCDRCGKLYEPKNIKIHKTNINGLGLINRDIRNDKVITQRLFDLCPECLVSLAGWLKNEPMTFNEIRKAVGLEPIRERDEAFAQLYSEKENDDGNGKEM